VPVIYRYFDMLKLFAKYLSVGVVNTLLHWLVFAAFFMRGATQTCSNLAAFCVAVTFSFFANARWTFNAKATTIRYIMFVVFMGIMASVVGWIGDKTNSKPIITLLTFSIISLVCGFIYTKFIIFRVKK